MTWARDVAERLHAAIGMRDTSGRRFDSDADTAEDYIKAVRNAARTIRALATTEEPDLTPKKPSE